MILMLSLFYMDSSVKFIPYWKIMKKLMATSIKLLNSTKGI